MQIECTPRLPGKEIGQEHKVSRHDVSAGTAMDTGDRHDGSAEEAPISGEDLPSGVTGLETCKQEDWLSLWTVTSTSSMRCIVNEAKFLHA